MRNAQRPEHSSTISTGVSQVVADAGRHVRRASFFLLLLRWHALRSQSPVITITDPYL